MECERERGRGREKRREREGMRERIFCIRAYNFIVRIIKYVI
jgi:hypothetical protein